MVKTLTEKSNIDFSSSISALVLIMDEIINSSTKEEFVSIFDISYVRAYKSYSCTLVLEFQDNRFLPVEIFSLEPTRTMAIWKTIVHFINWDNKRRKWKQ